MEKQVKTPKMIRQRRFMLVLPLLALPFMTLMFWSLGGGKVDEAEAQSAKQAGFNIKLPDANLKDEKPMDKMSYYDQAKLDSLKFQELVKNDPNYRNMALSDSTEIGYQDKDTFPNTSARRGLNTSLYGGGSNDPNAEKIYRKLAELDREMKRPADVNNETTAYPVTNLTGKRNTPVNTGDVNRLEQMMQSMSQSDSEDPEMQQLNGMLENRHLRVHSIDLNYEDVGTFRSAFSSQEKNQLAVQAEKQIRASVDSLGVLQTAETNASLFVGNFLRQLGYEKVTVKFDDTSNLQKLN